MGVDAQVEALNANTGEFMELGLTPRYAVIGELWNHCMEHGLEATDEQGYGYFVYLLSRAQFLEWYESEANADHDENGPCRSGFTEEHEALLALPDATHVVLDFSM